MKSSTFVFLTLTFLGFPSAGSSQSVTVEVTLKDGSKVRGSLPPMEVRVDTEFGSARVQLARIGAIEFGAPTRVITLGRHDLRGRLHHDELRLTLDPGAPSRVLLPKDLTSIRRFENGQAFGVIEFTGKWSMNFGPLVLKQTGDRVKGSYTYGELPVKGTISGRDLSLPFNSGKAEVTLDRDGFRLRGQYTGANGGRFFWGGYRIRAQQARVLPGKISTGQTKSWLNYYLRVPTGYEASRRYPGIVLLHQNGKTARDYVKDFVKHWPRLARTHILVGVDGERVSEGSAPGETAYDYTYARFAGPRGGTPSRFRESPSLVAEAIYQIQQELRVTRWFLAGHVDGGILSYGVAMYFPDQVAGILALDCELPRHFAPNAFRDPTTRTQQKQIAIAIVSGKSAPAMHSFVEAGFPIVRVFEGAGQGKPFAQYPLGTAVQWLTDLTAEGPGKLLAVAEKRFAASEDRDAIAALIRITKDAPERAKALWQRIESKARPEVDRLLAAIQANKNGEWIGDFLSFRERFGCAEFAKPVLEAFAKLRAEHGRPADRLYSLARRTKDATRRTSAYRDIVTKYYASKWYFQAKAALAK